MFGLFRRLQPFSTRCLQARCDSLPVKIALPLAPLRFTAGLGIQQDRKWIERWGWQRREEGSGLFAPSTASDWGTHT